MTLNSWSGDNLDRIAFWCLSKDVTHSWITMHIISHWAYKYVGTEALKGVGDPSRTKQINIADKWINEHVSSTHTWTTKYGNEMGLMSFYHNYFKDLASWPIITVTDLGPSRSGFKHFVRRVESYCIVLFISQSWSLNCRAKWQAASNNSFIEK